MFLDKLAKFKPFRLVCIIYFCSFDKLKSPFGSAIGVNQKMTRFRTRLICEWRSGEIGSSEISRATHIPPHGYYARGANKSNPRKGGSLFSHFHVLVPFRNIQWHAQGGRFRGKEGEGRQRANLFTALSLLGPKSKSSHESKPTLSTQKYSCESLSSQPWKNVRWTLNRCG